MNVFEKLQTIRCELQDMNLKKSGRAVVGKDERGGKVYREYYELSDFMPQANKLMQKHKAATTLTFGQDLAVLTFINSEAPEERIEFTSPMSTAALGNCHPVQNLGAVETFIKRYLATHCFDVMEFDPLEAANAPREPQKQVRSDSDEYRRHQLREPERGGVLLRAQTAAEGGRDPGFRPSAPLPHRCRP
jgi:hypothetical protein